MARHATLQRLLVVLLAMALVCSLAALAEAAAPGSWQQQRVYANLHNQLRAVGAAREAAFVRRTAAAATAQDDAAQLSRLLNASTPATLRVAPIFLLDSSGGSNSTGNATTNATTLTAAERSALERRWLPGAIAVLQKYIRVRVPAADPIRVPRGFLPRDACDVAPLPARLLSGGGGGGGVAGADLVLLVASDSSPTSCEPGSFAYTVVCAWDRVTSRPMLATVNVCALLLRGGMSASEIVATLVHELLHALAFNEDALGWAYDAAAGGKPYPTPPVLHATSPPGVWWLTTPRAAARARTHFACASLPGAPLDAASSGMHFSQRALDHELMTPSVSPDRQLSRLSALTLAVLDDVGVFETRASLAEPLDWGRGAGCDFVLSPCAALAPATASATVTPAAARMAVGSATPRTTTITTSAAARLSRYLCATTAEGLGAPSYDYAGAGLCQAAPSFGRNCSTVSAPLLACADVHSFDSYPAGLADTLRLGGTVGAPSARAVAVAERVCSSSSAGGGACALDSPGAMCVDTRCDASGALSLVLRFSGGDGGATARTYALPCSATGATLRLAALLPREYRAGALRCPDGAVVCGGQACGGGGCTNGWCDPDTAACLCRMEYAGPGCNTSLVPAAA